MSQVSAVSDCVRFQEMRMKYFQQYLEHGVPHELVSEVAKKSLAAEQKRLKETVGRFLEMQDRKYFPSAYQNQLKIAHNSTVKSLGGQP
jgi:uncharacterized membrane protein